MATLALIAVLLGSHRAELFVEPEIHSPIRFGDFDHALGCPVLLVAEHGPGEHCDLASKCDCGLLLASLLLAADAIVDFLGPLHSLHRDLSCKSRNGLAKPRHPDCCLATTISRLVES